MSEHSDALALLSRIEQEPGWTVEHRKVRGMPSATITAPDGATTMVGTSPSRGAGDSPAVLRRFARAHGLVLNGTRPKRLAPKPRAGVKESTAAPALPIDSVPIETGTELPDGMSVTLETVTPEIALAWLDANKGNRGLRQPRVDQYAEEMRTGNWQVTGAAIVFDREGTLIDGQTRLFACVQAEVPFTTVVMRGVDPEVRASIDVGLRRTYTDLLRWQGVTQYLTATAATVRAAYLWETYGMPITPPRLGALPYHLLEEFRRNHEIDRWAAIAQMLGLRPLRVRVPAVGSFAERAGRYHDTEVHEFLERIRFGNDLHVEDPAFIFRRVLLNSFRTPQRAGGIVTYHAALLVKAWNLHVTNTTRAALVWRIDEEFPLILGLDGTPLPCEVRRG